MGGSALCFHGFYVDEVGVVIIQDEQVGIALGAGNDEATGLIGEDFASGGERGGIAKVGAFAIWKRGWEKDPVDNVFVAWGWN